MLPYGSFILWHMMPKSDSLVYIKLEHGFEVQPWWDSEDPSSVTGFLFDLS